MPDPVLAPLAPLTLHLTPAAAEAVRRFMVDSPATLAVGGVRVTVQPGGCSGLRYRMALEAQPAPDDTMVEAAGIRLFVDPFSRSYLQDVTIDYHTSLRGSGFTFGNPHEAGACPCRHGGTA